MVWIGPSYSSVALGKQLSAVRFGLDRALDLLRRRAEEQSLPPPSYRSVALGKHLSAFGFGLVWIGPWIYLDHVLKSNLSLPPATAKWPWVSSCQRLGLVTSALIIYINTHIENEI